MHRITTDRGTIAYKLHGEIQPEPPPLIVIHGAGGNHMDWPAEIRRMPGMVVLALDLPGHSSSPGEGRSSVAAYTADLIALMDALAVERAFLGGHSMGSAIAMTAALEAAGRVAGLILVGTGARLPVNPRIIQGMAEAPRQTLEMLAPWMWARDADPGLPALTVRRMLETAPAITRADFIACDNFDIRDRLTAIQQPVLVITGDQDRMTPPAGSQQLAEQLPRGRLQIIAGAGHMVLLEQPIQAAAVVKTWLEEQRTPPG